jgi:long-chain fatty acid transport protein
MGRGTPRAAAPVLTALLALAASSARADFYNNRNFLVGERAAHLGGAFTAIADDATAGWYNPAGLASIRATSVLMTANAYALALNRRAIQVGQPGQDAQLNLFSFGGVPTTLGIAIPFDSGFTLAFPVLITDRIRVVGRAARDGISTRPALLGGPELYTKYTTTLNFDLVTTVAGPAVGYRINDNLSVGLSLLLHVQALAYESGAEYESAAGRATESFTNSVSAVGFIPVLGVLWKPSPRLRLGLSYAAQTISLFGNNSYVASAVSTSGQTFSLVGDVFASAKYPHRLTVGVALPLPRRFFLSADASYSFGMAYKLPNGLLNTSDPNFVQVEDGHLDVSVGSEWVLNDTQALRAGLFTNLSSAPDSQASEKVHMFGASLAFAVKVGIFWTSVGLVAQYGRSGAQRDSAGGRFPQAQERLSVQLVLGGSTRLVSDNFIPEPMREGLKQVIPNSLLPDERALEPGKSPKPPVVPPTPTPP